MNIIELLTAKGFVQDVDYSYTDGVLTALERTRMVDMESEGEVTQVEETYLVQLPSLSDLKRECVLASDAALLVGKYLEGKPVSEDDSVNLDLFLSGNSSGWRFAAVPAPSIDELYALIESVEAAQSQEQINAEALKYLADTDFYVVRFMETGVAIPAGISEARQAARERIVR